MVSSLQAMRAAVLAHLADLVLPPHLWGHCHGSMVEAVHSQSLLLLTLLLSKISLACSVHWCLTEVYMLKLECLKASVLFS